ncbi:hypothetical protein DFH08DRAFT_818796 [Mycena albidolilacea]|uniref:Uncharacterized protein n=1 Tax=Mycena albidolilacea TaxID=1033008 RepID=A0AAD7EGX1_9AGAR|nr:hypothetical protein DFH08DRAFT_818796 [Mycena albidolilacea]
MRIWQTGGQQACAEGQRVQRCTAEHQTQVARAGKAQRSRSGCSTARAALCGGRVRGRGRAAAERTQRVCAGDTIRVPHGRGAAGGGAQRSGRRGTMRTAGAVVADGERMRDMKGNMRGNRLGAQNAHGAKREGAQYAARGRGSRRQARGTKRRYGNSGGGRRRHVRRRMAVYRTTGWPLRPGGIFAAAAGGGRAQACGGWADDAEGPGGRNTILSHGPDKLSEAGELQSYQQAGNRSSDREVNCSPSNRTPEGRQQLLWKGLLRLEVQQGIATVYSTYGNGLAEGEGLATSRERRAAKGSWVARCQED